MFVKIFIFLLIKLKSVSSFLLLFVLIFIFFLVLFLSISEFCPNLKLVSSQTTQPWIQPKSVSFAAHLQEQKRYFLSQSKARFLHLLTNLNPRPDAINGTCKNNQEEEAHTKETENLHNINRHNTIQNIQNHNIQQYRSNVIKHPRIQTVTHTIEPQQSESQRRHDFQIATTSTTPKPSQNRRGRTGCVTPGLYNVGSEKVQTKGSLFSFHTLF